MSLRHESHHNRDLHLDFGKQLLKPYEFEDYISHIDQI